MKTEPTDLDRRAAQLFVPRRGMRVWFTEPGAEERACTVLEFSPSRCNWDAKQPRAWVAWDGSGGACGWVRLAYASAIDTDDPATVGCMLAQVETEAGPVSMTWDRWSDGQEHYVIRYGDRWRGPTRATALVAAMRALKPAP